MTLTWVSLGLKAGVTQDAAYSFTCLGYDGHIIFEADFF